jgi:hypothetical protein
MGGRDDDLVNFMPMNERVDDWQTYLDSGRWDEEAERLR